MSDQDPDKPQTPAAPSRSSEAGRRLAQLLSRPFGTPAPSGEAPEPYVPRPARVPPPAPAPPPVPPDDTASPAPPPVARPDPEPDLPWFDPPQPRAVAEPAPAREPTLEPEPIVERAPAAPATDFAPLLSEALADEPPREPPRDLDDLFDRRDPPRDAPAEPADDAWPFDTPRHAADESAESHQAPEHERVPEWAWPSALDRAPEAAPRPELHAAPEPLVAPEPFIPPEPARAARVEPPPSPPPPSGAKPLDPDAARTLGNIRRLMLVSNLFMVVAIAAVLVVVGYRIYRTDQAAPPPPPPPPAPAEPKIPNDMTLTLPRGARIVATAIAGDRLVLTLEIDGAPEIRTFDIKTLQPAGRLSFTTVP
jgi:hypothetical protein